MNYTRRSVVPFALAALASTTTFAEASSPGNTPPTEATGSADLLVDELASAFDVAPDTVREFLAAPDNAKLEMLRQAGVDVPAEITRWSQDAGTYLHGRALLSDGESGRAYDLMTSTRYATLEDIVSAIAYRQHVDPRVFSSGEIDGVAEAVGISPQLAEHRLQLQDVAMLARTAFRLHDANAVSEVWIDEDSSRLVVGVSNPTSAVLRSVLAGLDVEYVTANVAMGAIDIDDQISSLRLELEASGFDAVPSIDPRSGALLIEPIADGRFDILEVTQIVTAELIAGQQVDFGEPVSFRDEVTLRGAISWSSANCTAGFVMGGHTSRTNGIITAGHCDNTTRTWNGKSLPHVGQAGPDLHGNDTQWHDFDNAEPIENQINISVSPYVKEMTTTGFAGVNDTVCHQGNNTGHDCGTVDDTNYFQFVRVDTNYQSDGGDSGGPVYIGNTALGAHKGSITSGGVRVGAMYVNVDHINGVHAGSNIHIK